MKICILARLEESVDAFEQQAVLSIIKVVDNAALLAAVSSQQRKEDVVVSGQMVLLCFFLNFFPTIHFGVIRPVLAQSLNDTFR